VQVLDHLRQLGKLEIGRAVPGVEVAEPEINCVGPVGDGGAHRIPVSGGGEQFRTGRWSHL
jgi:hypothetical protein